MLCQKPFCGIGIGNSLVVLHIGKRFRGQRTAGLIFFQEFAELRLFLIELVADADRNIDRRTSGLSGFVFLQIHIGVIFQEHHIILTGQPGWFPIITDNRLTLFKGGGKCRRKRRIRPRLEVIILTVKSVKLHLFLHDLIDFPARDCSVDASHTRFFIIRKNICILF